MTYTKTLFLFTAFFRVKTPKTAPELVLPRKAEPGKAPVSAEPHRGDVRVIDNEKQVHILGFGRIKDAGGGNAGTVAEEMGSYINSIMAGSIRYPPFHKGYRFTKYPYER